MLNFEADGKQFKQGRQEAWVVIYAHTNELGLAIESYAFRCYSTHDCLMTNTVVCVYRPSEMSPDYLSCLKMEMEEEKSSF